MLALLQQQHFLQRLVSQAATDAYAHQLDIFVVSVIVAAIFAFILLLPRYETVVVGGWVAFLGWVFAVFALMYAVRAASLTWVNPEDEHQKLALLFSVSDALLAGVNVVLMLFTAFYLLGNARLRIWYKRVILLAGLSASLQIIGEQFLDVYAPLANIPNAFIFAFCLGSVGYALAVNISFLRHNRLAGLALIIALFYGGIHIPYALRKNLATMPATDQWLLPEGKGKLLDSEISVQLKKVKQDEPGLEDQKARDKAAEKARVIVKANRLRGLLFAIALPLKFALFIPAFLTLNLFLTASSEIRRLFAKINRERFTLLVPKGLAQTIGESLQADVSELLIRVPGERMRVVTFLWRKDGKGEVDSQVLDLDKEARPNIQQLLLTGKPPIFPQEINWRSLVSVFFKSAAKSALPEQRKVYAPIRFHGAVIGCLKLEMEGGAFNVSARKQLKAIAEIVSPIAQAHRELASLDQLTYLCTSLQGKHNESDIPPGRPVPATLAAVQMVAKILHQVCSPLATGIILDIGFQERHIALGEERVHRQLLSERMNDYQDRSVHITAEQLGNLIIYENEPKLTIAAATFPLGKMMLAVPSRKDEISRPTLGSDFLYRRSVRNIVANTLLELSRENLDNALKNFNLQNNLEAMAEENWFESVCGTAHDAELLWAVATKAGSGGDDQTPKLMGEQIWVDVVQGLPDEAQATIEVQLKSVPLPKVVGETRHVICVWLPQTKQLLWFGVARADFGLELNFASPWKLFLEHFAELADTALYQALDGRDLRRLQEAAANEQALATVAATTGTMVHQLVNMTRNQLTGVSTLNDALHYGWLQVKEDTDLAYLISDMRDSAVQMQELIQSITNVAKVDGHRPCSLQKAAYHALDLFKISLDKRGVRFKMDATLADFMLDVPYYVAALTLANLVSNAKDAFKKAEHIARNERVINISAAEIGGKVVCLFSDSGPGVPEELRDRIFDLGVSTKPNSGGWGLYLVKRSLKENGANITLTDHLPGQTTFTIVFPQSNEYPGE